MPEHFQFVFTPELSKPRCQHPKRAAELGVPWLKPNPSPASNNTSWLCFPLPARHHFLPSADVKIKQTQPRWPGQAAKTKCHRDRVNAQGFGSSAGQGPPPPFLHVYLAKNHGYELGKHLGRSGIVLWHSGNPELVPAG